MAELIEKSATWGLAKRQAAGITLTPLPSQSLIGLALLPAAQGLPPAELVAALAALGLAWPPLGGLVEAARPVAPEAAPELAQAAATAMLAWSGRDEALLFAADLPSPIAGPVVVTQQTGALAGIGLEGAAVPELLARLIPLDLRQKAFAPGSAARSLARHIPVLVLRRREAQFELYVPRSMLHSFWAELATALDQLAARG